MCFPGGFPARIQGPLKDDDFWMKLVPENEGIRPLQKDEQFQVWHLDQASNFRGMKIVVSLIFLKSLKNKLNLFDLLV